MELEPQKTNLRSSAVTVLHDVQKLINLEVRLWVLVVTEAVRQCRRAVVWLVAGACLAMSATVILCFGLAKILTKALNVSDEGGLLIVGGVLLLCAVATCFKASRSILKAIPLPSEETHE